jgi:hypothetical protein
MSSTNGIILDDHYTATFDERRWLSLHVTGGPHLPLTPSSTHLLHRFLNDPTQEHAAISEAYSLARNREGGLILSTGWDMFSLSQLATERLRDFLDQAVKEQGGERNADGE